ncbi:MAG TPA: DJ-1/PfpI family protein [Blastocatellia bacterium]|nr:DJ-1/PfpI family protein [Blastocatellia bacterium]
MNPSIIAFDDFTDIDVFFLWDLLNRVKAPDWKAQILGEKSHHTSISGLTIPMHGHIELANASDVVLFASGPGTRAKRKDEQFLSAFKLDPERQMIGSMCSGALLLAALGLLAGKKATTYPTSKGLLEEYGVEVVEKPFVLAGNVATAAGCLAAQYLAGWVIERAMGAEVKEIVLKSIQPVGEGLSFADADITKRIYEAGQTKEAFRTA